MVRLRTIHIHLKTYVEELKHLIDKHAQPARVAHQCRKIRSACTSLVNEHGTHSDIAEHLEIMMKDSESFATSVDELITKKEIPTWENWLAIVNALNAQIVEIHAILKVMFGETQT